MKGRYQIKRTKVVQGLFTGYKFELIDTKTGTVINDAISGGIIAPEYLRKQQARLNTKDILG